MCREDEQKRIVDFSKRYLLRLNYVIMHDLLRCPGKHLPATYLFLFTNHFRNCLFIRGFTIGLHVGTSDHMHPEVGQYRDATTFCECSVEPQVWIIT